LKQHGIELAGIIFNGDRKPSTEDFIIQYTQANCIAKINREKEITKAIVKQYADEFKEKLNYFLK